MTTTQPALPTLNQLGRDLLETTPRRRVLALCRPPLELTYHLQHHLYPQVPSHHLAELGRRLDPVLASAQVTPRRVI